MIKLPKLSFLLSLCTIVVFILLLIAQFAFHPITQQNYGLQTVSEWQLNGQPVHLPYSLSKFAPRTSLTLTTKLEPNPGDCLYLKTVYLPLKVYADDNLIFEYGYPGSYPSFLLDPPTKVALVSLPNTSEPINLRFEYLCPSQRNVATLYPVLAGTSADILIKLFSEMGFSLFFSVILISFGIILFLITFVLIRYDKAAISFFWLGLFSLCTGIWVLGECNLTGIFIENASLLYLMAFTGLFTFAIPLIKFGISILNLKSDKFLKWICVILEIAACIAAILQLSGTISLSKTMYLFHVLVPLSLCSFGAVIFLESFWYQNKIAHHLLLPISLLALSAILEVGNYYFQWVNVQKSFFFQIGVLAFLLIVSVLCGYFMKDIFELKVQNQMLSYEIYLMEKQVEIQKARYQIFSETEKQIRQQHHDLKHHLVVIRNFLDNGELEELPAYLDELSAKIPKEPFQVLCENDAVNAVASYYFAMSQKIGTITCKIHLDVPKNTGRVPSNELCVIVGNLLQNAITACQGMENSFIHMNSRFSNGVLTIIMDNSCSAVHIQPDGTFSSLKKGGGMGLNSIRSVAKKYDGYSCFEVKDGVFLSSVYLKLEETPVTIKDNEIRTKI